jgi:hypothetical protein
MNMNYKVAQQRYFISGKIEIFFLGRVAIGYRMAVSIKRIAGSSLRWGGGFCSTLTEVPMILIRS